MRSRRTAPALALAPTTPRQVTPVPGPNYPTTDRPYLVVWAGGKPLNARCTRVRADDPEHARERYSQQYAASGATAPLPAIEQVALLRSDDAATLNGQLGSPDRPLYPFVHLATDDKSTTRMSLMVRGEDALREAGVPQIELQRFITAMMNARPDELSLFYVVESWMSTDD